MQPPDHVVVGTGFTGLLYATLAVLKGESVLLYEKRNRSGGLIGSVPTPFGLVETAANGILNSYRLEELAFALNLDIISAKKNSKQRFIWKGGNPKRIPLSFSELLRLLYGALTISAGIRPEESVYQWGVRVLGKGAVENLLEPGLAGIYAGNLKDMSAELVLGRWISSEESLLKNIRAMIRRKKTEQKIPKGRRGIVSFRGGLGELLTVMETKIKSSPNSKILYSEESPTLNSLRKKYPKAKIVLACGLESSLKLLSSSFPVFKRYEKICKTLGIVTATRFGNRPLLDKKNGFGILFPPDSGIRARGVLLNSSIFPERVSKGHYSETFIFGGALDADIVKLKEDEIVSILEKDREKITAQNDEPVNHYVTIWKSALPVYDAALLEFNRELDRSLPPGVVVEGNFRYGIGLSSILERVWNVMRNGKEFSLRN
ncbi:protoporphyrinogen oxidase [Leptospira santarosai]|uniref:Coproporphyrinogen III oxidase n=1 Tax=Leptospira santarosai serovar Shermani str. LT 821 TaxID=758847 RepID=K8Y0W1_9LEPT|nr:protoporphyrinogen oxidase [Leptospira santarosai]EKT87149.1 protoporphyrinogen oxidase [Leptospira santarosai serovar Shermani str. LT 821]EPG80666.1 protoporphyrinogen oxidase [Leptospira santarosai serovar Shermani str. 1342KT]MDI7181162.1 protoporphyrinogen oxidase [Leptospira santarosai]